MAWPHLSSSWYDFKNIHSFNPYLEFGNSFLKVSTLKKLFSVCSKVITVTASALEGVRNQVQEEHHEDGALRGAPAFWLVRRIYFDKTTQK